MSERLRIGIDLGGTKIAGIVMDASDAVAAKARRSTPRNDYQGTLKEIVAVIEDLEGQVGERCSVGVATPGSLSPKTGRIQNGNSVWLNGQPMQRDLEALLGRETRFANDADCFALSEARDGAAVGAQTVFGVIIGTGCGGGIVAHDRLVTGPHHTGGEWGHMPLPWPKSSEYPGPRCWCGRMSCMETWVSGTGMARDHAERTGERLTGEEIVAAADRGEAAAQETLSLHADRLARGLGVIVNTVDPHVIVLGGGLSQLENLYEQLPELIAPHIFADHADVTIRRPVHGAASGVRGAARLWDA